METHQLMRVWCAPHQGDIVIRAATNEIDNGAFYKTAHAFSVHLRQQQNLILEMQVRCPRDTNRWMYFERILSFMLKHRRRLEQWIEEKRPVSAPSPTWWVMCASVQPLAELCNTTMTILQSHDMILYQQMAEIKSLIGHLVTAMDVKEDRNHPDDLCYVRGQYWIQTQSVREHIYDQGLWAHDLFNSLSAEDQSHVLHEVVQYTLKFICGWSDVQAERDERNNAGSIAPPVLPAQLVKLRTGTFISDVLDKYRAHIGLYWSAEDVEQKNLCSILGKGINATWVSSSLSYVAASLLSCLIIDDARAQDCALLDKPMADGTAEDELDAVSVTALVVCPFLFSNMDHPLLSKLMNRSEALVQLLLGLVTPAMLHTLCTRVVMREFSIFTNRMANIVVSSLQCTPWEQYSMWDLVIAELQSARSATAEQSMMAAARKSTPFDTPPVVPASNTGSDFLRVSYHCKATKCFRLQWESEMNPRCPRQTTIVINNDVYIFDGFYLLCHSEPPEIPRFEYTRGGVMCKVHFILEDLPSFVRGESINDVGADSDQYLFQQLLGIQPAHLFANIFLDPDHATGDVSEICGDYHLIPRFIAVNIEPLLHIDDLHSPNRVGYAVGRLLSLQKILEYLDHSAKFTARDFLHQFDHRELIDCVVSTRINGQPSAFRVDKIIMADSQETEGNEPTVENRDVVTKDGRHRVRAIAHYSAGARSYDGAKSKKKIRKWQEVGPFLQLSPEVEPHYEELLPTDCHLTGIRSDLFEVGSAMPMVLKYVRHFILLTSFESTLRIKLHDKALLRQAFTHGSYVDVGMQNVNTVEATRSRVRLGHVFENVASLKRSRSAMLDGEVPMSSKALSTNASYLRQVAEKHLSGDFKEEFHSRYLCPYERLEFLGDAVLSFLVASSAFFKFPAGDEGFLHQTRVDIVNNVNLGKIAKSANFESLVLSAFDLAKLSEEVKSKITADCFEALLGALYKDQGIAPCRALLGKLMDLHDPDLRELCFLSTEEVIENARAFVEKDHAAIKQWSKYTHARLLHRRFRARSGVEIVNTHVWLQAVTHASFQKPQIDDDEFIGHDPSYERIEFIGDAVLQLLSSEFLVDAFPFHQEHLLTQVRSSLVKNTKLATVARQAGYEDFIRLGNEVKKNGNLYVEDVLADVFEATLGAVYVEKPHDLGKVRAILERLLFPRLTDAIRRRQWMNPRKVFSHYVSQWSRSSSRQISCQFKNIKVPRSAPDGCVLVPKYKDVEVTNGSSKSKKAKPNEPSGHAVALYVNNFQVARAVGRTIAAAQDAACKKALMLYGQLVGVRLEAVAFFQVEPKVALAHFSVLVMVHEACLSVFHLADASDYQASS
ncbi:hypothetical protein PsorP6_005404 [Peronosclerospora sorghi]|uniref:Uncharacterized protein n=1 Tax=Peronosclerospora sorghi TaxID=230839 RepID=A0ACC0W0M7_9STRA|nr:hypothetical protein PsorP6_005404 [Peronosclerospora sorghi]